MRNPLTQTNTSTTDDSTPDGPIDEPHQDSGRLSWLAVAIVSAPIAFAAIRAAAGDWVPIGDDAYFTVRARDVLTSNNPLLGAWSSGSLDLDTPINNLGPTQADLLAPFTRWTPWGGTAIGVAVINIAAIITIAWLVRRIAGHRAVLPAMVAVGLLTWTMGSEMLITPRQHQFLILPYMCLLVATWAVASGDRWAIVPAVVAGSLVAQTHLSYPVLVAALTAVMVVGHAIVTRAGEARGGRRPFVVSGVVLVALWVQTGYDQFFGFGNLGHVLFGSGGAGRAGLSAGARMVAAGLISPHMLLRPGYRAFDEDMGFAAPWQSLVFWLAVVLAAAWAVRTISARGWRAGAGTVVALVAVLAGVLDAAMLPETAFGFEVMNYRWLWPTAAFIAMLVLIGAQRWLAMREARSPRPAHDWFVIAALAVCSATAVANLPRSVQNDGSDRYFADQRNVEVALDGLEPALDSIAANGPIVIDESEMYFGHPYTYPVLVAMQSHDIDFRFEEPRQERRFGTRRVSDGTETQRLKMLAGQPALDARDNPSTVAFVDGQIPVAFVIEPT